MANPPRVPYQPERLSLHESSARAQVFLESCDSRRSVRNFSSDPVPRSLIETAIRTASTAPSGAHRQPWTFVAVSNPLLKHKIRLAAEAEERASYETRMNDAWKEALKPLETDWNKPYLETAPWLVVLFAQRWSLRDDGSKRRHYYVLESCGIAAGVFVTAIHQMGLSTLTHTPSPMRFLGELLARPEYEKPLILFPVGYAAADCSVPDLTRKTLDQISVFLE